MKCSDFEKTVLMLAADSLMEATTRSALLRHAEACARCDTRLTEERALISGIRGVRGEIAGEQAPVHVEAALLKAFREHSRMAAIVAMPRQSRVWFNWKLAAIAAALVLLTAAGALLIVRSPGEIPAQTKSLAPPDVVNPPNAVQTTEGQRDQGARIRAPHHARKRPARATEAVTEFFPLNEGEDLELAEFVQVIRVELSASSLRDVGLPMSYASADAPVKADVALGPDGIARAIRFVR